MTTAVLLRGHLGAKFGTRFDLNISSPAHAVRALCHRVKGFRDYVEGSTGGFKVLVNNQPIGVDELGNPTGGRSIRIVPVVSGAKGDFGKIIMGVALIAAVYFTGGMAGAGWSMVGTSGLSTVAINMGIAMVAGGIAGMLAGSPGAPGYDQGAGKEGSYLFSGGGANPTVQGGRYPVLLGRMEIAGIRISGGIDPESGYSPTENGSGGASDGTWTSDGHGGRVATKRAS